MWENAKKCSRSWWWWFLFPCEWSSSNRHYWLKIVTSVNFYGCTATIIITTTDTNKWTPEVKRACWIGPSRVSYHLLPYMAGGYTRTNNSLLYFKAGVVCCNLYWLLLIFPDFICALGSILPILGSYSHPIPRPGVVQPGNRPGIVLQQL